MSDNKEPTLSAIYMISVAGKLYVGSAVNYKKRKKRHKKLLNTNRHPNKHLQAAYNKYQDFNFQVLEFIEDPSKLLEHEKVWIDWTRCCDPSIGYNKRAIPYSNYGLKLSQETRAKISASNKGKREGKGRPQTEEMRRNQSIKLKGRKHSPEHVEKRRQFHLGKSISKEQKIKISNTLKGNKNALGHEVSDEAREKISEKLRDYSKWPHAEGSKCPCDECLKVRRANKRNYYYNVTKLRANHANV